MLVPKGEGPEGWGGPRRVGAPKGGGPKFRVFFPSPTPIFSSFSLSEGLLVDLWQRVQGMVHQIARLGSLGSFGEPPAACAAAGARTK